jgi:arabinofuranosyltransferase
MPIDLPRISILSFVLAVVIAIAAYWTMPWWTVDDAFISYRYGHNLVTHGALTWNPGMPVVEGYTGILLPLLSAALLALGLPLVGGIKLLGIISLALIVWLNHRALVAMGVEAVRRAVATLLLLATPLVYVHSISGLETIFFTLALTVVFACLADQQRLFRGGKSAAGLGAGLVLAAACRPEGIALAAIVTAGWVLTRNRFDRAAFRRVGLAIGCALLIVIGYWVWRSTYYQQFLPNSYHAKVFKGWINPDSLWAFAKFAGYYCALPFVGALILGHTDLRGKFARQSWLIGTAVCFALVCGIAYSHSHLWMNYGSRFFFPFLPVALMLLAYLSSESADTTAPVPRRRIKVIALSVLLSLQLGVMGFRFHQEWAFLSYYHRIVQDELIPVGQYLHTRLPAGSKVISFMDAGAVGYYSQLPIVDFGRLNDPVLTQGDWTATAIADYFFMQDAVAIVMTSTDPDSISYIDEAMALVSDPRFAAYARDTVLSNQADYPYYQHVFLRRHLGR